MAFIREVKRGNRCYYYLVESYREGGKPKQRTLQYLGTKPPPRRRPRSGPGVEITVWDMLHPRPKPAKTSTDYVRDIDKLAERLLNKLIQISTLELVGKSPLNEADRLTIDNLRTTLLFLHDAIKKLIAKTEVDELQ